MYKPNQTVVSEFEKLIPPIKRLEEVDAILGTKPMTATEIMLAEQSYEYLVGKRKEIFSFLLSLRTSDILAHIEYVRGMKCKVPENKKIGDSLSEENVNQAIIYAGRFNYNQALEDVAGYFEGLLTTNK